jgi:hypothetical protein
MGFEVMDSDWSRARIREVMHDSAERCASFAAAVELTRVEDELAEEQQRRSSSILRWSEAVFRAWERDDRTVIAQLNVNDLEFATKVLRAAERGLAHDL